MYRNNRYLTQPLSKLDFCVVDTETTGGSAQFNRVIDIAVLRFKGGEIVEKFQTLLNPQRPIPEWITNLTGITDEMVRSAPVFSQVAPHLQDLFGRGVFTAHNVRFDYSFLKEEFRRIGQEFNVPSVCTLKLARMLYPDIPSRSLGVLCEYLFIDIWDRHRAYGDAEATVYVLKEILRRLGKDYGINSVQELMSFRCPKPRPQNIKINTQVGK